MPPQEEYSWGVPANFSKKFTPPQSDTPQPSANPLHPPSARSTPTGMAALVMRLSGGLVRDEKHAMYVLLAVVGMLFLATLYLWNFKGTTSPIVPQNQAQESLREGIIQAQSAMRFTTVTPPGSNRPF
jgi:hypothetical protein